MLLLIDYDNVGQSERRLGLDHIFRKSMALIDQPDLQLSEVRARLYGGWYDGGTLTRLAQALAAELREISPVRYSSPYAKAPVLVRGELATSILAAPRALINNTFRKRGYPRNLQCERRPWLSCANNSNCSLASVQRLFENSSCDSAGCTLRPEEIIYKQEQKVVDSMMVVDLIEQSREEGAAVAIISRDDDIWPGLYMASKDARVVIHVSTATEHRMPRYYDSIPVPPYRRVNWS